MKKIFELETEYCEQIPEQLTDGVLYISKRFSIAAHNCACGCGTKTITGLKPYWKDGWSLTEKKQTITLRPSIGNFSGEKPTYHAHYLITESKIEWC